MTDDEITVESLLESRVIYGSPQTVTERLAALRHQIGPFGTLVVSAMDWSGPNQDWEQELLHLLATQVRPAWNSHIHAQAAE